MNLPEASQDASGLGWNYGKLVLHAAALQGSLLRTQYLPHETHHVQYLHR